MDELHNLDARGPGRGESVNVLKSLLNSTSAVHLYAGIDLTAGTLLSGSHGQQIASRFSAIALRPYDVKDKVGAREWRALLRGLGSALPLTDFAPGYLVDNAEYLHARTGGRIGALCRLVTGAAIDIITSGSDDETLSLERFEGYKIDLHSHAQLQRRPARVARSAAPSRAGRTA